MLKGPRLSMGLATLAAALAHAVGGESSAQAPPTSARVETAPLELIAPDRYQIPALLEPVRRVRLVAMADGIVRRQEARAGAVVRDNQEIVQLDRTEAAARLKIAQAVVKELAAAVDEARAASASKPAAVQAEARLEAAQARAQLAQLELDRCTVRAPFAGKVLASPISDGQYVGKGETVAELADVSSLRALVPVARTGMSPGSTVALTIEGESVSGQVQALLPLPESLAIFRELSAPFASAWVTIPNPSGNLEPGQRAFSGVVPMTPIATVPAHALMKPEPKEDSPTVQVIRNDSVTRVKVTVLGKPGPDRVQLTGALRPTDALIVSSSVPLLPGTLIRFSGNTDGKADPMTPQQSRSGDSARITAPRGAETTKGAARRPASSPPSGTSRPAEAKAPPPF